MAQQIFSNPAQSGIAACRLAARAVLWEMGSILSPAAEKRESAAQIAELLGTGSSTVLAHLCYNTLLIPLPHLMF